MKTGVLEPSGLTERQTEEDHCRQRCGAEETTKEGRRKGGISEAENKERNFGMGFRHAWSKVPVTITSLAPVYGPFLKEKRKV